MKQKEVELLVKKVSQEMKAIGIPISDNIEAITINNRAKKRLGCCKRRKNVLGKTAFTIEISRYALSCEKEKLCSIIAHELLHTCKGCFNHGDKWKKMGIRVEKELGYPISRTVNYEELGLEKPVSSERTKYIITCKKCGQIIERKRMCNLVKNVEKYRCGKCGAPLELKAKSTTSCR